MSLSKERIAYVLKMYPRLSETFILNEILAHEAAGVDLDIFSLRVPGQPVDHADLQRVRAEVTYLANDRADLGAFGQALLDAHVALPQSDCTLMYSHSRGPWIIFQAFQLAQMVRERGIRHLHAHFATEATTVARLASFISGVPYSVTAHAKDIFHESVDEHDLHRKIRDAAAVITVSDFNVNNLRDRFGADASCVSRIYNGLDLEAFPFQGPEGRDPSFIVGVGRLVEKKGFADLIDACHILAKKGRPFDCVIIGDGDLRSELQSRIAMHGLEEHVQLAGPLPRQDVRNIVSRATLVAAPCVVGHDGNRDGLPTVLLEAMALGTPCVSTPVTGIPEIVNDGRTGLMVPERAPASLADAMDRLMENRALAAEIARNARDLIQSHFDVHRNTEKLRQMFIATPARALGVG